MCTDLKWPWPLEHCDFSMQSRMLLPPVWSTCEHVFCGDDRISPSFTVVPSLMYTLFDVWSYPLHSFVDLGMSTPSLSNVKTERDPEMREGEWRARFQSAIGRTYDALRWRNRMCTCRIPYSYTSREIQLERHIIFKRVFISYEVPAP